jgi:O-antigen ligase
MKNTIEKLHSIFFILLGLAIPLSIAVANILIGLITLCWLLDGQMKNKLKEIRQNKWMLSIILLLVLYCCGMLWGSDHQNASWVFQKLSLLLMFIVLGTSKVKKSTLKFGALLFLFSTLLSAIAAILINYQVILPLHNYISIVSAKRQLSAFTSYNYHTILLAFSALICFFLVAEKKTKFRWGLALCFFIYSFSIFTESGRAGQLIFTLLFGLYSIYYFKKRTILSVGLMGFLILCNYSAYKGSDTFKIRIDKASEIIQNEIISSDSASYQQANQNIRTVFFKEGINYIIKKPIFGYGTGSFGSIFDKDINSGHEYLEHTTPHNSYLYIWFEVGILGLLMLLRIFYFQFKSLSKLSYGFDRILLPIGFMTIMLFDSYLFIFVMSIFYIYFFTIYNNYNFDSHTN